MSAERWNYIWFRAGMAVVPFVYLFSALAITEGADPWAFFALLTLGWPMKCLAMVLLRPLIWRADDWVRDRIDGELARARRHLEP